MNQPNLRAVPMVQVQQVPDSTAESPSDEQAQAEFEGADTAQTVDCLGAKYRIADRVGLMPLMRFAAAAKRGLDTGDMEAMAAIYDMLADCIDPRDWSRFEADMTAKKAQPEDMLPVVQQTIEALSARPTSRPSDSSDGPPTTGGTSTGGSSSPARPDREGLAPISEALASRA